MSKATMLPAWTWDCPECGAANAYTMPVVDDPELAEDIRRQCVENGSISEDASYEGQAWYGNPLSVKCRACKEEFETEFPVLEDDDDDAEGEEEA